MFFIPKIFLWLLLLPLIENGTAFNINAGLSGTWHDNEAPGQGLIIDVMPANNSLFAGWFTYLPDEDGGRNQYWLTALGPFNGSMAELTLYETDNGQFNVATDVEHIPVGFGTLQFHDCTTAQFNFYLNDFDRQNSIELTRVTPDVFCAQQINPDPAKTVFNYPPVITNLTTSINNQTIDINYDLSDSENDLMALKFLVFNDHQSYEIPLDLLSGHVNYPVMNGQNKRHSWHYLDDIGFQQLQINSFKIKVSADDRQLSDLSDIIESVSEARIIADIQAIEGIRHHQSFPGGLSATRTHIKAQMDNHHLPIIEQIFNHRGSVGINIIGTLSATEDSNEVYIIDGHYDTVSTTPGADDNASGTAGMLEAMRVLSQLNVAKNIKFIGFDKEELGLIGSRYYSSNRNQAEQIKGLINFEMIGYTCRGQAECVNFPNADTSIYNIKSSFADTLSETFNHIGATYVPALKITPVTDDGDANFRRSDHAPFWDLGIDALFLTDGANFRTPHYHKSSDRLSTLDTEFMTQVVKTAVGTLATLAQANHTGYAVSDTLDL